jgi:hypothetical protein
MAREYPLLNNADLLSTIDAEVWAKDFMSIFGNRKEDIDEELMFAWFANAIMCGYDYAMRLKKEEPLNG